MSTPPTKYTRKTNFTAAQQSNPSLPPSATALDQEFNALKATTDQTISRLGQIQRDDGALANGSVGRDQLAAQIAAGINPPAAWVALTSYSVRDSVIVNNQWWWCSVAHTSRASFDTTEQASWQLIIDFDDVSNSDASALITGTLDAARLTNPVNATNVTTQRFLSGSGTYTRPSGVKWIDVIMVGGGGGGGSSGTAAQHTGTAGGDTTFGTRTAGGGAGGTISGGSAVGGAATGSGLVSISGSPGGVSWGTTLNIGGNGGASPFAGAGLGGTNAPGAGTAAADNSGSGGGGGGVNTTSGSIVGGGGGSGAYIEDVITSPSATYSYGVGAKGTGGAAGTNGAAGGDGGSGGIWVIEHYNY